MVHSHTGGWLLSSYLQGVISFSVTLLSVNFSHCFAQVATGKDKFDSRERKAAADRSAGRENRSHVSTSCLTGEAPPATHQFSLSV